MDRCHLNGLCLQDDKPKYVTALAETDSPYDEEIACLQEAIEKEPDNADAHNSLGFVYSQRRELEKASGHYERVHPTFARACPRASPTA